MWFSLQQVGSGWEALVVDTCHCSELVYRYNEYVSHRSERSLHCEILMCNVIVEILCGYINVYLLRISRFDNLIMDVHVDTLA